MAFDEAGIDYAFTGALAISYYGVPRTTSDIDVMVEVGNRMDVGDKVAAALGNAGLRVDKRKIDDALSSGFKIATFKDRQSQYSLDVIFFEGKIQKRSGQVAGLETYLQSPEGLIAAKMRMIKVTLSPERAAKDRKDISAVLKFTKVDLSTVKTLSEKDGTFSVFESLGLNA